MFLLREWLRDIFGQQRLVFTNQRKKILKEDEDKSGEEEPAQGQCWVQPPNQPINFAQNARGLNKSGWRISFSKNASVIFVIATYLW